MIILKKEILIETNVKVQEAGTNVFITLPSTVRSILKAKGGDIVKYTIYDDKSIEIKLLDVK